MMTTINPLEKEPSVINEEQEEHERDDYEELLKCEPWLTVRAMQDSNAFTQQTLRDMSVTDLNTVLPFFNGKSPSQQKKQLAIFLKELPAYKTTDISLLHRRFENLKYLGRKVLERNEDVDNFFKYCGELGFVF